MTTLTKGTKVEFLGSCLVNNNIYKGLIGTVDFECTFDNSGLVYINIRAKGQRKDRSICVHKDSLRVVS